MILEFQKFLSFKVVHPKIVVGSGQDSISKFFFPITVVLLMAGKSSQTWTLFKGNFFFLQNTMCSTLFNSFILDSHFASSYSVVEVSLGKFVDENKTQLLKDKGLPIQGCAAVAGRTDKGVTALQQVCSFCKPFPYSLISMSLQCQISLINSFVTKMSSIPRSYVMS